MDKKVKVYLAGPMRGYPKFNFPAFFKAAKQLRKLGYKVFDPAEADVKIDKFNPAKDKAKPMSYYMLRDLPAVLRSDAVVTLPGWEKSKGAQLEVHVARECDIPVLELDYLLGVGKTVELLTEYLGYMTRPVRLKVVANGAVVEPPKYPRTIPGNKVKPGALVMEPRAGGWKLMHISFGDPVTGRERKTGKGG